MPGRARSGDLVETLVVAAQQSGCSACFAAARLASLWPDSCRSAMHTRPHRVFGAGRTGVSMPYRTDTFRIAMAGPADMSGLIGLIEDGVLDPLHIAAVLVKTEGNGGVNDFTREYTCATMAATLAPYLRATNADVERRIAMVVSGGTEGVLSPHATVFARTPIVN